MAVDEVEQVNTWLSQAADGNPLAVQKLILLFHPRLRAVAARRLEAPLRGKVEPEDVLQQVYVDAVQHFGDFEIRGSDAFFAWLKRILESKLIDTHRRFHTRARDVDREVADGGPRSDYELLARTAVDSMTPSRVVAREEVQSLLLAALAGLSADHRRVLELRFLNGHTLSEVAAKMGRSTAAAQMLCARALRQLHAAIRDLTGWR